MQVMASSPGSQTLSMSQLGGVSVGSVAEVVAVVVPLVSPSLVLAAPELLSSSASSAQPQAGTVKARSRVERTRGAGRRA